jgi:hypothetical protein
MVPRDRAVPRVEDLGPWSIDFERLEVGEGLGDADAEVGTVPGRKLALGGTDQICHDCDDFPFELVLDLLAGKEEATIVSDVTCSSAVSK